MNNSFLFELKYVTVFTNNTCTLYCVIEWYNIRITCSTEKLLVPKFKSLTILSLLSIMVKLIKELFRRVYNLLMSLVKTKADFTTILVICKFEFCNSELRLSQSLFSAFGTLVRNFLDNFVACLHDIVTHVTPLRRNWLVACLLKHEQHS